MPKQRQPDQPPEPTPITWGELRKRYHVITPPGEPVPADDDLVPFDLPSTPAFALTVSPNHDPLDAGEPFRLSIGQDGPSVAFLDQTVIDGTTPGPHTWTRRGRRFTLSTGPEATQTPALRQPRQNPLVRVPRPGTKLWTRGEAAYVLNCSLSTVDRLRRSGELVPKRQGRFWHEDVEALAKSGEVCDDA
jgi:hypothetical protein